jgi:hypothetical protein
MFSKKKKKKKRIPAPRNATVSLTHFFTRAFLHCFFRYIPCHIVALYPALNMASADSPSWLELGECFSLLLLRFFSAVFSSHLDWSMTLMPIIASGVSG